MNSTPAPTLIAVVCYSDVIPVQRQQVLNSLEDALVFPCSSPLVMRWELAKRGFSKRGAVAWLQRIRCCKSLQRCSNLIKSADT